MRHDYTNNATPLRLMVSMRGELHSCIRDLIRGWLSPAIEHPLRDQDNCCGV